MTRRSSTVVEHSPPHSKIKCSSPAAAVRSGDDGEKSSYNFVQCRYLVDGVTTLSITTFSIMTLSITLK